MELIQVLIIIRNEENLSLKANFIVKILSQNSNNKIFYIFKKESNKFEENWFENQVQLPSSVLGLFIYYLLIMLKSPKDIRDGLMVRLSIRKAERVLTGAGFFSMLSRTLYLRFGTSARDKRIMHFLKMDHSPKLFLVDEFLSLHCLDLKKLRFIGPIIYISQDIAYNRFGFGDNLITRKLMFQLEQHSLKYFDLVVACSEMERLKYLEMGARKSIFYPNMYPTKEFKPCGKDESASIGIVLREHWGHKAAQSLETIFKALARLDKKVKVYMIGIRPKKVPKNVELEYMKFIQSKLDYLKILSKTWIGINVGIHMAGTNERKYDYAESGMVVISDKLGSRGDLLPHEYTYVDGHDLAAKIKQLLQFGKMRLTEMGETNRRFVILRAEKEQKRLLENINKIVAKTFVSE